MREFGELFGSLIIVSYILALLSFVFKWKYKHFKKQIDEISWLKTYFPKMMRFFIKYHRFFGFATVLFILIHFGIQFSWYGPNITGAIAASFMFLQIGVGIYGVKKGKSSKGWLWMHRSIAVMIGLAILIHIN